MERVEEPARYLLKMYKHIVACLSPHLITTVKCGMAYHPGNLDDAEDTSRGSLEGFARSQFYIQAMVSGHDPFASCVVGTLEIAKPRSSGTIIHGKSRQVGAGQDLPEKPINRRVLG